MKKFLTYRARRIVFVFPLIFVFFCLCFIRIAAQESPVPVLISESDSTRALVGEFYVRGGRLPRENLKIVHPGENSRIILFVSNIDLTGSESSDSLRVYAED